MCLLVRILTGFAPWFPEFVAGGIKRRTRVSDVFVLTQGESLTPLICNTPGNRAICATRGGARTSVCIGTPRLLEPRNVR